MGAPEDFGGAKGAKKMVDGVGAVRAWRVRPVPTGTRIAGSASLSVHGSDADQARSGYEAGRAQGEAEALKAAQQARSADLQRVEALLRTLQERFDELSARGADALLDLALDIAGQVVRHDILVQREAVLPIVRDALTLVINAHAHPTVRLAPRDFELVRDSLSADAQFHGCRFVSDPGIAPGGCRVESPQAEVDATLPTRWRRVLQTLGCTAPPPEIPADGAAPDAACGTHPQ